MQIKDLIPIIEEVAPSIASALGSPIAGLVVSALCAHAGISPGVDTLHHFATQNPSGLLQVTKNFMESHGDIINAVAAAAIPGPAPDGAVTQDQPINLSQIAQAAPVVDKNIAADAEAVIAQAGNAPFAFILQLWKFKFLIEWSN